MRIVDWSVKNPMFGHLVTLFILVAGIGAACFLRREVFPETNLNLVVISTLYRNASPSEVEDLITIPLEEELREIDELEEFTSLSMEGLSSIVAQIDGDVKNKDRVIFDIQRKIDRAHLPNEAEDPDVEAITTEQPVIRVYITGGKDEFDLRIFTDSVKERLEVLPGVATVERDGWRDEEFWVEMNPEALQANEVSIAEVVAKVASRNVNLPGGKLPSATQEIVLRTVGKFYSEEEIEKVVLRSNFGGQSVNVGDIASVRRTFEPNTVYSKVRGERAIVLGVKQKDSGDTIDVANEVKALIAEIQESTDEKFTIGFVDDVSFYVKRRLNIVASNGLMGIVLVFLCLLLFLDIRISFFTAFGIPFSFLGAFVLMYLSGVTINLMTMFGMIIVLGMVVDDAIIVGENIYRHLEDGMEPYEAARRGANEVAGPVVATVLTTIAAFLPLFFAPDVYSDYLGWLVIVVVATLCASLFECLIVLPSHAVAFVRLARKKDSGHHGHRIMKAVVGGYGAGLKRALKHRYVSMLIIGLGFFGLLHMASKNMRVDIFPGDLIDVFVVKVTGEPGSSLEQSEALATGLEELIQALPDDELETFVTIVGKHSALDGANQKQGTHLSQVNVYLTTQDTRERLTVDIIEELRSKVERVPGLDRVEFDLVKPGPPVGKALEIKVKGKDFEVLQEISLAMQEYLRARPGTRDVGDDFEEGKDEIHVVVREEEAARLGLSVQLIARTVLTAFEGVESTVVREGKEEVAVRVRLAEPWRSDQATLAQLKVRNNRGRLIALKDVADFNSEKGLANITHHDGLRVITVGANVDVHVTSSVEENTALLEAFKHVPKDYPGYSLVLSGEGKETKKIKDFMIQAFAVALMMIYLILAMQFNSFFQPFILLTSIPLGLIGVVVALTLHDKPVSIMAMMGMVGLAGVVVNDAIVLVSFANDLRAKGTPTFEALLEAGKMRLRPILLTSITTIAGLFPVIYGWGGYEPFIAPAAIALAYGLMFATFLTLVVVPCTYHIFFDVKQIFNKLIHTKARNEN